jgi:hypothetical protein
VNRNERVRRRLAHRLNTAYANGLISDDTYTHRLDQLLTQRLIDAHSLVGDLTERTSHRGLLGSLRDSVDALLRPFHFGERSRENTVLALDWTGTVEELVIGRSATCDVIVKRPEVSRRHARLVFRDGSWFVHDLASTNGTTVNGTRVGRCRLLAGDRLDIGGHRLEID